MPCWFRRRIVGPTRGGRRRCRGRIRSSERGTGLGSRGCGGSYWRRRIVPVSYPTSPVDCVGGGRGLPRDWTVDDAALAEDRRRNEAAGSAVSASGARRSMTGRPVPRHGRTGRTMTRRLVVMGRAGRWRSRRRLPCRPGWWWTASGRRSACRPLHAGRSPWLSTRACRPARPGW
jgi:hypothetical protein